MKSMENKNNIIDELKERWACYDQVRFLFEQPFERQREALLDIEGKVRAIVGGDPEEVCYRSVRPHCKELRLLLLKRYWLLNWMFIETPEAYERMRIVNQHLYEMDCQLHEQIAEICEKIVREPKPSFVDDYEVRAMLGTGYNDEDSVVHLSLDDDYGSDLPLMISVNECLLDEENYKMASHYCGYGLEFYCPYDKPKEVILHNGLDDGVSWAHKLPTPFEGLCICHTTASFVKDLYYPVFDLLHFNSFWSEVLVAYQHFSSRVELAPSRKSDLPL